MKTIWIINHYVEIFPHLREGRFYNFALNLIKKGYKIHVFTASTLHNSDFNLLLNCRDVKHLTKTIDAITVTYINVPNYKGNGISRVKNMLGFSMKLNNVCKLFLDENPDAIYASMPHMFAVESAQKFAKKHKLPCIVEVRDLWPLSIVEYKGFSEHNPAIRVLYGLEKKIYKRADALVFTMQGGKDYIVDKKWEKKVNLDKVFNINNGIDIAEQDRQREENIAEDADLTDDSFKVVYAGSIRTANCVDIIVKAAQVLRENEKIKFLIYGDGDKRAELERFCVENGLTNVLFKGKVDKKYIPYICSRASLNVISVKQTRISQYGVSWNKLFDYMNAGRPIFSTVQVNYDLIRQNNCGISLIEQSPEAIANAILQIYNLPQEEYAQMCENAKRGAKDFDYTILTDKLEEVIEYAIAHHRAKK